MSRFSQEQIVRALRKAGAGREVGGKPRKLQVTESIFFP